MSNAIATIPSGLVPAPLWRDPHSVPPEQRLEAIRKLELACRDNPESADLRACLAMAHAVNYDAYRSLDALTEALHLDPNHFFAQLKMGELWYRLRALPKAEEETIKALNVARTQDQYQVARAQLQQIRTLLNNSVPRPTWNKPLRSPMLFLAGIAVLLGVAAIWR